MIKMTKVEIYQFDLLRKRRGEKNQKITFSDTKKLKRLGFIIGLLIASLGISLCSFTSIYTYQRIRFKERLAIKADQYQRLKENFESDIIKLRDIYKINSQIADGIIGINSGSSMLLEITQLIPITIKLNLIEVDNKNIFLSGLATQPNALESINSFKLQVSNSFLFSDKATILTKVSESRNTLKSLDFRLTSNLINSNSDKLIANYEKHGSYGLLKRVSFLKREGLIE